jgi:methionine-rich copper-binding protein CopC
MREGGSMLESCRLAVLTLFPLLVLAPPASAHAVLLESRPGARSTVSGPEVGIFLRFNVRIDGARSQLGLLLPDQKVRTLRLDKQGQPEALSAKARGLEPGSYRLRWQVLASDGHITRGEVPFEVR